MMQQQCHEHAGRAENCFHCCCLVRWHWKHGQWECLQPGAAALTHECTTQSEATRVHSPTHVMEESARLVTAAGLASWEPLPLQPREKPLAAARWSCMLTNVTLTRSPRLPSPAVQGRCRLEMLWELTLAPPGVTS